ncbi:hypothetical protein, partial [uncultured Haemophilus sp.]|uniref:hypothetical protein n=1 Tax=uncultured Haemophilus sp. TaxID=237779 RepID=UPI0026115A8B
SGLLIRWSSVRIAHDPPNMKTCFEKSRFFLRLDFKQGIVLDDVSPVMGYQEIMVYGFMVLF